MRTRFPWFVLACAAACGPREKAGGFVPRADTATVAPASVMGPIVGVNVAWGDRYARGDAAGLAALYAEDAVVMTPAGDVVGRQAIQDYFAQLFRTRPDSVLATSSSTEVLDVAGARAYEAGTLEFTLGPRAGRGPVSQHAVRYMTFWQQAADGHWMIRASLRPDPGAP